jgi:hypothetical protein
MLVWPRLSPAPELLVAGAAVVVLALLSARGRLLATWRLTAALGTLGLGLLLALLVLVTLMTVGYLELTTDRPVLILDVTGESRLERVAWQPPNQPPRVADLRAHRVVFRTPAGETVGETWLYGDEVAVKARVVRLAPWLNAAGLPNLLALEFVHNGYRTMARHADMPHLAVAPPPLGPVAVRPWWPPLQRRLLAALEGTGGATPLVRTTTVESTAFPLTDAGGQPQPRTYRLVLTPGGLSGS